MKKFLGIVCLSLLLYCNAYSDIINEIKELNILFKDGYLTKEEFSKAKKILIGFEEEAPKKIIEEENYYELLYRPNDDKIDEWKKFKKSSSDYNVWVEIRRVVRGIVLLPGAMNQATPTKQPATGNGNGELKTVLL